MTRCSRSHLLRSDSLSLLHLRRHPPPQLLSWPDTWHPLSFPQLPQSLHLTELNHSRLCIPEPFLQPHLTLLNGRALQESWSFKNLGASSCPRCLLLKSMCFCQMRTSLRAYSYLFGLCQFQSIIWVANHALK